jgi:hypothetical protein
MASEAGGRADKLGNEFERLWAVQHLIEMLAGRALSVQIECVGDDEKGTEFWVARPDGTREAHQCKRENASHGRWSVATLESKRVISNAKYQLDRNSTHRFVFVSSDKAPHLSDLCERAARCENAEDFRQYLVATSRELFREFRALCSYLRLDPDGTADVRAAFDFLRRFRALSQDKVAMRGTVESLAGAWLTGDPLNAVAALKDLVDRSIGRTIRFADVLSVLPPGTSLRDLSRDPVLPIRLQVLQDRFDQSYRHLLIGGHMLKRRETDELWQAINSSRRVVLLHGPGGEGKSGVVFELAERLRDRGLPYLPLRLDRDRPADSPAEFGRQLELPASPAACLAAVAGVETGVLILDQVDAIRWTSAHSSHAWDTCERLIAETLRHSNLSVVVVCRTFDVEDDPRIRAWKDESNASEIKVGPLDDETLDRIISDCGVMPSTIGLRQRRVLRSAQGLFLWRSLQDPGHPPVSFRTIVDLMRTFWRETRRKLRQLRPGDYEGLLDALVEYLDRRGAVAAPETVVSRWIVEVEALVSMNVFEIDRGRIVFTHQSYLDHLTAERVLREVHGESGTVLGWLEANDQSLFRRGQLRQVLALLRDDDTRSYEEGLRQLLTSDTVRFHLKHLVLQLLGQADPPTAGEINLALNLITDEKWGDHVSDLVFSGRTAWADALHSRGTLGTWLDSENEKLVNRALYLLNRVSESRGELVEALLLDKRMRNRRKHLERVLWLAAPEKLSSRLFRAFVQMTRNGSPALGHLIRWRPLAEASPARCIDVLEASLRSELRRTHATSDQSIGRQELRTLSRESVDCVAAAAARIPLVAWDKLVPLLVAIVRDIGASRRAQRTAGFSASRYFTEREVTRITTVLTRVLQAAGSVMAATDAVAFWERVGRLSHIRSTVVRRLLARCMAAGADRQADASLGWLIADPARLRCGGKRGGAYKPAFRLLRRFSRLCSDEVFSKLLSAIVNHRPEAEKRAFLYRHQLLLESLRTPSPTLGADILSYQPPLELGQYLLLSALAQEKLPEGIVKRLAVLRRKFGPSAPLLKGFPRLTGGWVRSTIPKDHLSRLSDRHWAKIVNGRWHDRRSRWRQMARNEVGEATVRAFATDLGSMTKLDPQRFARFGLLIPANADPAYARAILQNLTETRPPGDHPNPETWHAASVQQIEALADHFEHLKDDVEFAMALCWIIIARSDELWSRRTYAWLATTATSHPHPREHEYAVYSLRTRESSDSRSEPDILATSINCVRGVAAETIQATLFARRESLQVFRSAIDSLTSDPHPAVRAAAIGLALPLFNIDRATSIMTFLAACSHQTDEVLRSRYVNTFLGYTILTHAEDLRPLIERMTLSRVDEVAKSGAGWVGVVWAHRGIWDDRLAACLSGAARLREGVAAALALAVADECINKNAVNTLGALFDDPDPGVRAAAARFFRGEEAFDTGDAPSLVQRFAASAALDENMSDLLSGLDDHPGELKDYADAIFTIATRLSGPLAAQARDHQTQRPMDAALLAKVLLRLYEQAENHRELRQRCLDSWDSLISQRIGIDTLDHIDA